MNNSIMAKEAAESPNVIERQIQSNLTIFQNVGEKIRQFDPQLVYIVGRGSSDHAGVFAKYLIEIELGIPVSSSAPSVTSIFKRHLKLDNALVIVISQSGRSPDILEQTKYAKESGALCLALVNDEASPLAELVNYVIPLKAGEEKAVAATKSFIATLSAVTQLVAHWKQDHTLINAINSLPSKMRESIQEESQLTTPYVGKLAHCVVLGRSLGYAISREIALKLKEVCGIHAEAFSSAEFLHGPVTLVEKNLAIIDVTVKDESFESHQAQIEEVAQRGAELCHLSETTSDLHPRLAPLTLLQRFYLDIENIAQQLGFDPDNPVGLRKVTKTL
jgi:glucosamine--fructose-6-phosphate aminotransferase (isomerizing)